MSSTATTTTTTTTAPLAQDVVLDRLQAMMYQEDTKYRYGSYFPPQQQTSTLNHEWREKICQWTYNVVDTYDLPREIVALSLDYFDRYLATRGNQCNGTLALLVSLTTLHIAMKVHSSTATFKLSKLAELSRGQFGPRHIEQMEWQIMMSLQWKLHPPTLFAFVSYYLMLFAQPEQPSSIQSGFTTVEPPASIVPSHAVRKELFEVAIYMAELSVCDSFFVPYPASIVALAALSNVMEDMPSSKLSQHSKGLFWNLMNRLHVSLDPHQQEQRRMQLLGAKDRLRHMLQSNHTNNTSSQQNQPQPSTSTSSSNQSQSSSLSNHTLTSSPTSAAEEIMAMEDCYDHHHHHSHHDSHHTAGYHFNKSYDADEEAAEEAQFRYSPSPPTSHHSQQPTATHNNNNNNNCASSVGSISSSTKYLRSINSASTNPMTLFTRGAASPASRARMACSPIVAGLQ
jgi:hypothetical protein